MAELVLTEQNFEEEVLRAKQPVLVDFWATWCGPCRMLAPVIEEIANEYEGKVKVGKVNVDDERELALEYGVSSIPTVSMSMKPRLSLRPSIQRACSLRSDKWL